MLICLTPGRTLRWAPPWNCADAELLFDASSGDFWLLGAGTRTVIDALQDDVALDRSNLIALLQQQGADGTAVLRSLGKAGLLARWVDGAAVTLGTDD